MPEPRPIAAADDDAREALYEFLAALLVEELVRRDADEENPTAE